MPQGDPRRVLHTEKTERRQIGDDVLTYHHRSYGGALPDGFCGGIAEGSVWMDRGEVIAFLEGRGYRVTIGYDEPNHQNGPCACLYATRI